MRTALVPVEPTLALKVRRDFVGLALEAVQGTVALGGSKLHPFCFPVCSALVAFDESGCVCGHCRWLFGGGVCDVVVYSAVSLPSYSVRVSNSHDLDLPLFALAVVIAELGVGFGGFRIGSDLLLDDSGGSDILRVLVCLDEGVDGRLVSVYSKAREASEMLSFVHVDQLGVLLLGIVLEDRPRDLFEQAKFFGERSSPGGVSVMWFGSD